MALLSAMDNILRTETLKRSTEICVLQTANAIRQHAYTLFLFTCSDFKTIFIPITVFSSVAAPVYSLQNLTNGMIWIWLHLLQCNVSNQYKTREEDLVNKPWRPLPSGRVTLEQAAYFRWALVILCASLSSKWGPNLVAVSLWLTLTMVIYDEVKLAAHWLGKNVCAVSGYVTFELGSTIIMSQYSTLDRTAALSVLLSAMIILTTIHVQDFADISGDSAIGRETIPIRYPKASRLLTSILLILWSIGLSYVWQLTSPLFLLMCATGTSVAYRVWMFRTEQEDKKTYVIYNLWLAAAHCLPLNVRLPDTVFIYLREQGSNRQTESFLNFFPVS